MIDRDFSRDSCLPLRQAPLKEDSAFKYGKNGRLRPVEVSEKSRDIKQRFKDLHQELRIARQFICRQ